MRTLDLFSGIGGFALGLQWAGFPPPVAFCECDPFCQRVLRKHWPDVPIQPDVRELSADAVGPVDLICGGFPCQPWSVAGQQRGTDDDRDLWPEMLRLVAAARPRWVLGENVGGFVSHPLGLDRVLADLEGLGYACQAVCIPACAVDAPHIRDRVWILAHAAASGRPGNGRRSEPAGWPPDDLAGSSEALGISVAHALGSGPQERAGERGDDGAQRPAAERGRDVGEPECLRSLPATARSDSTIANGERPQQRVSDGAGSGVSHWRDADWLWCDFDQRWRRTQPGVRLLAHGIPGRVARLRALGNAVVPQIVEQIGRAILEAA